MEKLSRYEIYPKQEKKSKSIVNSLYYWRWQYREYDVSMISWWHQHTNVAPPRWWHVAGWFGILGATWAYWWVTCGTPSDATWNHLEVATWPLDSTKRGKVTGQGGAYPRVPCGNPKFPMMAKSQISKTYI
jgi:hypothetical protein